MKYANRIGGLLLVSVCTIFAAPVTAVTIDYVATSGSFVSFDPTDSCGGGTVGCFDFNPALNNITINNGSALNFQGKITGTFGVGAIANPFSSAETASVSGSGQLIIFDGSTNLTADLVWVDIFTFGTTGGINTSGTANLTNISYGGSNADLVALASFGTGTQTSTFQFANPTSLTELFTTRSSTTETSFSGSINAVPVPPAVWLFGSGLLGMVGIARRRKAA